MYFSFRTVSKPVYTYKEKHHADEGISRTYEYLCQLLFLHSFGEELIYEEECDNGQKTHKHVLDYMGDCGDK